jgi:hypothetical protein
MSVVTISTYFFAFSPSSTSLQMASRRPPRATTPFLNMEDPLTSIRNLVSALCLISETMEEPFGLVVQELARNIGDSVQQLNKEHSYFFYLHHPRPPLEDSQPPPDKDELGGAA